MLPACVCNVPCHMHADVYDLPHWVSSPVPLDDHLHDRIEIYM